MSEYDGEPIRGLPARLPPGETILWQGGPVAWSLAQRVFHLRTLGVYFALLEIWHITRLPSGDTYWQRATISVFWMTLLAAAAIAVLVALAWLISRTTVYTITGRRVVIRFGVALPMTVNIPFCAIEAAALGLYRDGSGDLALAPSAGQRVSYAVMWPHVRPWRVKRVEPMLRCVPQAANVSHVLSGLLAATLTPTLTPSSAAAHGDAENTAQPGLPPAAAIAA
jgi:Bacterial PH domain